jgi:uncharacterized protein (TIGR02231 family)
MPNRRARLLLPFLLLLTANPVLAATVATKNAKVVEVTVYADRAEVVREVTIDLPAGPSTLEFADIPRGAEPDSFRLSAKGVPAVLGAVEIRERADAPKEAPERLALQQEVDRIQGELDQLAAQDVTAGDLRTFLKALGATTAQRESESLGSGKADVVSIGAVFDLLSRRLGEIAEQGLARGRARTKLQKELEVARAKLAAAKEAGAIESLVAAAELETRQAGSLTLRVAYLVHGASWTPSYRATLDASTGGVSLVSEGVVRQQTGEDWKGVVLRLSTAAPATGVAAPELEPLLLRPTDTDALRREAEESRKSVRYQNVLAPPPPLPRTQNEVVESVTVSATITPSAYNVSFEVPGRSDVPSDDADHRVVLRQEELPGTLVYRISPALEPAAYLTTLVKAPAAYPLLAGSMRALAGGTYLGVYDLPETAPGAELTLPFGRDNRIKVDRVALPQDRSTEGLSGRTREIVYAFKTTVENLRDQAVTLLVEDRVPVSEDEKIVVELDKSTTAGHEPSKHRPGVMLWKLTLAPREKKEMRLAYTVRLPRDVYVPGLD